MSLSSSAPVTRHSDIAIDQPGRATIDVDELRTLLEEQRPVTVLDVRKSADRAEWAIPGSIHVDAYEALQSGDPNALDSIDIPVGAPVVTVCAAGKTSLTAMAQLRARGYDARSLAGGMKAWSLAWNSAEVAAPGTAAAIVQVRRIGKGCLSYLIGNDGEAAVIDAALPPEVYQRLAAERGWAIRHVLDTHVHADHLSRSRLLASANGATLHLPAQHRVAFSYSPVRDGDGIAVGSSRLVALRTPGHTMESTCYLLDDVVLFSGDALFLDGVGRPDLEASAEEAHLRAHALHHSLRRLLELPPTTTVLPGHTSTPVAFDRVPLQADLIAIRDRVALLREGEDVFVAAILARIPPTPPNHASIVALNEAGLFPSGDPTELEAGANRCAVS